MCSLLNAEKHINSLEEKISSIFLSLNQLLEFSSENGKSILEIREIIPEKEDVIKQFNLVYSEIENLKKLIIGGNEELKQLILDYSNELRNIVIRVNNIEKAILPEKGTETNV
jgi:Mg2+ and Co2+ transporter CorA